MGNSNSFLIGWAIRFIENRGSIRRDITNIEKNKDGFEFIVNYKDKSRYFVVETALDNSLFSKLKNDKNYGVFTLNNGPNTKFIIDNWKKLIGFSSLSLFFANPFSTLDKVWIINPYIHDKICDVSSLRTGLKSMASMVEIIDKAGLEKKIKLEKEESDQ